MLGAGPVLSWLFDDFGSFFGSPKYKKALKKRFKNTPVSETFFYRFLSIFGVCFGGGLEHSSGWFGGSFGMRLASYGKRLSIVWDRLGNRFGVVWVMFGVCVGSVVESGQHEFLAPSE